MPDPASPTVMLLASLGISPETLQARGLRECPEARNLEVAEAGSDGRPHRLAPDAATAWRRMKTAAADDGVMLEIVSAFRGIDGQAAIIRRKIAAGESIEGILRVSAAPGFSEHHTGRAIDLHTPGVAILDTAFARTRAYQWLECHAGRFGFTLSYPRGNPEGYQYEPWHWCYTAVASEPETRD